MNNFWYYIRIRLPKILKILTIIAVLFTALNVVTAVASTPSIELAIDEAFSAPTPTPLPFFNPYNPNSTYFGEVP